MSTSEAVPEDTRPPLADSPRRVRTPSPMRLLRGTFLLLIALLLIRILAVEPFQVPTGSMAPVLFGHHKTLTCPRCGHSFDAGIREGDEGFANRGPSCPRCGCTDFDLDSVPVCPGDHLLVNKTVFEWRKPRRWEPSVFHCPRGTSKTFVKRIVGLPGESVQIKDGDVFIDHDLARKTLAEFDGVRLLVFDQGQAPGGEAGAVPPRWESVAGPVPVGTPLHLDLTEQPERYGWAVYDHSRTPGRKASGVRDEIPYNGTVAGEHPVHDFELEGDLEVVHGDGWVALGISDGADDLVVELPVGELRGGTTLCGTSTTWYRGLAGVWPAAPVPTASRELVYRTAPLFGLQVGRTYHLRLAFVDRRLTLQVDGSCPFAAVDRPAPGWRGEVIRPVRIGASGVEVRLHNARLYRDIHYTEAGKHGTAAPVRLGAGEYFVLGDNSPGSQDSRFWSGPEGQPALVREKLLIGKPVLVHWPSRVAAGKGPSLDWDRIRWVR